MIEVAKNSPGEDLAKERNKRVARVWRDTVILALIAGLSLGVASSVSGVGLRWALVAVAVVAVACAMWIGTVRYYRTVDEQERFAAYWSATVGLYSYALLFGADLVASRFGLVVPNAEYATFWIVSAITLAAFLWKRYR